MRNLMQRTTALLSGLTVERPRPASVRSHPHAMWFAVATVCFGAFMGQLDASIVTLIFPALQRDFAASLAAVQWVSLAYLLALVGLLALAGRLADAAGRKLVYLYGFAVFTAASAACGLAPSLGSLIVFRVVQALGAAMLQANSVALVVTSVPRTRMRAALGVQAAAQALGLALGPTLGGVLVTSIGWRWVFGVNVPVGIVALVTGRYLLPRTRERSRLARFDWPGLILLATATTALLLAVSAVSGLRMPAGAAAALAGVTLTAAGGLWWWERRFPAPLVDMSLLASPRMLAGLAGALGGYLALFAPLALYPQVLTARGGSELHAGLLLTALPAGFAGAASLSERLLPTSWTNRGRGVLGTGIAASAFAGLGLAAYHPAVAVPLLALVGIGLGLFVPANNATVMGLIPARSSATGGGLVNMTRGLGTALGVAVVTFALHAATRSGHGVAAAEIVLVALAVVSLVTGLTALVGEAARPRDGRATA